METFSALLATCTGPRSPVNSPHKGQWREALMFTLICAWINGWVNNRKAGDLRRNRAHYDVSVMMASTGRMIRSKIWVSGDRLLWSDKRAGILAEPLKPRVASRPWCRTTTVPFWGGNTRHRFNDALNNTITDLHTKHQHECPLFGRASQHENQRCMLCYFLNIYDFNEISPKMANSICKTLYT